MQAIQTILANSQDKQNLTTQTNNFNDFSVPTWQQLWQKHGREKVDKVVKMFERFPFLFPNSFFSAKEKICSGANETERNEQYSEFCREYVSSLCEFAIDVLISGFVAVKEGRVESMKSFLPTPQALSEYFRNLKISSTPNVLAKDVSRIEQFENAKNEIIQTHGMKFWDYLGYYFFEHDNFVKKQTGLSEYTSYQKVYIENSYQWVWFTNWVIKGQWLYARKEFFCG